MKDEHKRVIEEIITKFKNAEGFIHSNVFALFFNEDHKLRIAITKMMGDLHLIESVGNHAYRLTLKGWEFTSFEELDQKEAQEKEFGKLEFELAKSNIEANKLNKEIAERNRKNEITNSFATWINVGFGLLNLILLIWQLIK